MDGSLQITLRDLAPSPQLERQIRERMLKLERLCPDINSCRVVVEMPQRRQRKGRLFQVQIDLHLPGKQIVVDREHDENVSQAIHDAFDLAKRRVEEYVSRRREQARANGETDGEVQEYQQQ